MSTGGQNNVRVGVYLDTQGIRGQLRQVVQAELASLSQLEIGAFRTGQTQTRQIQQLRDPSRS